MRWPVIDFSFRGWLVLSLFLGAIAVAWVVLLGTRARSEPARCPDGFVAMSARCCAPGQGLSEGRCVGTPSDCPAPFELVRVEEVQGCSLARERVFIEGGSVTLGPTDWDSADVVERRIVSVRPFMIDRSEVTTASFRACIDAGLCAERPLSTEPGQPVVEVTLDEATEYCAYVGGRLPTTAEWIFAASGTDARRYPWGPHGLVCRRASYGLSSGPCGEGGSQPELVGMRPDGATPDGLLDMAGNVAEWTLNEGGPATTSGGSYVSKSASDLKTWAGHAGSPGETVGFRCVYETLPAPHPVPE